MHLSMAPLKVFIPSFLILLIGLIARSNAELSAKVSVTADRENHRGLKMNWIERKIKEEIESLREVLRKGDPVFGIPILDPYTRVHDEIKVNSSVVVASTDVRNFSVLGLSSYAVDDVRVSLANMSASIRLSWTGIKAKGNYKLEGQVVIPYAGNAPLYGNGTARGLIYNVWVESTIRFKSEDDDCIKASDLNVSWQITNPQVHVDGLFGGLELGTTINNLVEDIVPKLGAAYHDKMQKILEERGLKYINDFLTGITDDGSNELHFRMLN